MFAAPAVQNREGGCRGGGGQDKVLPFFLFFSRPPRPIYMPIHPQSYPPPPAPWWGPRAATVLRKRRGGWGGQRRKRGEEEGRFRRALADNWLSVVMCFIYMFIPSIVAGGCPPRHSLAAIPIRVGNSAKARHLPLLMASFFFSFLFGRKKQRKVFCGAFMLREIRDYFV